MISLPLAILTLSSVTPTLSPKHEIPPNRIASASISEDFINEQLQLHVKSDLLQELKLTLDPDLDRIFLRGIAQVPVEELRAINLEPSLGKFRFQIAAKVSTTKHGHLVVEFPLNETFFYPVNSKNPKDDRVIVPVQMLSIALASARGYLAALSGDFGGFDRRTNKFEAMMKTLDHSIAVEKNKDTVEDLKTQRDSLRLQIAAIPIERKQLQSLAKELSTILAFTGEKEISLNDELAARKNALILKIKLSQLTPYLDGVELGDVRLRHDKKDGGGQNYLTVDINAKIDGPAAKPVVMTPQDRPAMKTAPSLIVRLNQSLFESDALLIDEKKEMGSHLNDFQVDLRDDGLHVSGRWRSFLILSIPFETIVDFVTAGTDAFEMRVREIKVAGIDVDFLGKFILEALKKRLNHSLKGMCKFQYVGKEADHSLALRANVNPAELVPAFSDLHLVDIDVREKEFLLKMGRAN